MQCPKCGEPIRSRHSFCVVCGFDLQELLAVNASKSSIAEAGRRFRDVLNTPITPRRNPQNPKMPNR